MTAELIPAPIVKVPLVAGGSPRAIVPTDFEGAYRIANVVVAAGMAPKTLNTVEKAMVAILHGLEVGLTPMNALQSIAVINGRPTIWGDGAIGLIRASGLMEYMQEKFEGEGEKLTAVCIVKRKGEPKEVRGEFSWSDVIRAGLNKKEGPWQTYPRRMMQMRARWPLRDVFADVLKGLSLAEEVQDMARSEIAESAPVNATPAPERPRPPSPPKSDAVKATLVEGKIPSDGFPGDKPLAKPDPISSGPQPYPDMPDAIKRKRPLKASEQKWLMSVRDAYGQCETKEALDSERDSVMFPAQDSVSDEAWAEAEQLYQQAWERIEP